MTRLFGYCLAAVSVILACPLRAETINRDLSVSQGDSIMLDAIYALKEDCSPGPLPELSVKKMPINGQLRAGAARFPIATDKNCPNVNAKSLAISYFPYPNFTGKVKIVAALILSNGKTVDYNWNVEVVPKGQNAVQGFAPADIKLPSR